MLFLAEALQGKNSTITVDAVKDFRRHLHFDNGDQIDRAYVLKVQLSKQLPPERVNSIINLILMFRRSATDNEIENALVGWKKWLVFDWIHIFKWTFLIFKGYLYGTEAKPMTIENVEPMCKIQIWLL